MPAHNGRSKLPPRDVSLSTHKIDLLTVGGVGSVSEGISDREGMTGRLGRGSLLFKALARELEDSPVTRVPRHGQLAGADFPPVRSTHEAVRIIAIHSLIRVARS